MLRKKEECPLNIDGITVFFGEEPEQIKRLSVRAVSKSLLSCAEKSENELVDYLEGVYFENEHTVFGRAVHTSILEPKEMNKRFSCFHFTKIFSKNEIPWTSKSLMCYHSLSEAIIIGKKYSLYGNERGILFENDLVSVEQRFGGLFKFDNETYYIKGFIDVIAKSKNNEKEFTIIDIKTSRGITLNKIEKSIIEYGYDMQMYIYVKAFEAKFGLTPKMSLHFIDKDMPFNLVKFDMSQYMFDKGRKRFEKAMHILHDFAKRNKQYNLFLR